MDGSSGCEPALTPLEVLEDQITALAAHLAAGTFRLLALLREFDERGGWSGDGLRSCAHWLNWRCGIALGAAREKMRVAHALPALPLISAAFERGEVSYSKVRAMTRVATPANEASLLNVARHGTAHHVERLVRGYRRVLSRDEAQRRAERYLTCYEDEDGCFVIHGRIPAEQGALIMKALEAAAETVSEEEKKADAPPDADVADHVHRARRADALALMAETFLAKGPGELAGGERYQVVVHVFRGNVPADRVRLQPGACRGAAQHRPQDARDSARDHAGAAPARQRLPLSRLHLHALRGRASRAALGGRRRDEPFEPGAPLPLPSPAGARGRLLAPRSRRRRAPVPAPGSHGDPGRGERGRLAAGPLA
jgi:hypothetical protein